ncbi:Agmatinase [Vibrio stylophorae]|uniref:Agmatinase n=1 Tax=Vibrio stylophorae TaxID=659351 RepID=A0ABN8DWD5_9VIBR|nr:agmatinase [Vibrio stylophorae]CAH0533682.1 Agmatinase [Vibrio stylophorae]
MATHNDTSLYANNFGFMRQPLHFKPTEVDCDVVITGVPFDLATTGRSGSRMGPTAMRQISTHLAWEEKRFPWTFTLEDHVTMVDAGDLVFETGNSEDMMAKLEGHTSALLAQGKTCLSFGGDHFVTLPLLRAHAKTFGKMALIHFDAHTDTYDAGGRYDHGTMFYHAPKEGLIDPQHSVQIGIRTDHGDAGFTVIDAPSANDMAVDAIVAQVKDTIGDLPVYLTFDIDCLDPAYAPGTGTPVCGGLSTDKVLKILRGLAGINLVGMDVVEIAPAYDQSELTALAGATIASELLHMWAVAHKGAPKA